MTLCCWSHCQLWFSWLVTSLGGQATKCSKTSCSSFSPWILTYPSSSKMSKTGYLQGTAWRYRLSLMICWSSWSADPFWKRWLRKCRRSLLSLPPTEQTHRTNTSIKGLPGDQAARELCVRKLYTAILVYPSSVTGRCAQVSLCRGKASNNEVKISQCSCGALAHNSRRLK
jgi:hypothetical protein